MGASVLGLRTSLLAACLAWASPALAQNETHAPEGPWRTVTTDHYRVHYPLEAETWALEVAGQLDGIRARVAEEVGWAPTRRVDIVVMDPYRQANGFALPFMGRPRMGVFATPPGASSALGNYRTWAEDLVVHEDAHLVHLMRPTRSPFRGFFARMIGLGPVTTQSPGWVVEGYATVVEGRLTGRGRPNSDYRATMLRSLAQEGRMPSYAELDGGERWAAGRFRYLVGSAFLEWLEAGAHEGALVDVWARLSARKKRRFAEAFEGVFGDSPEVMYGRYTAELTRDAMALEATRPLVEGTEFADLDGSTGAPTLSADGTQLAAVIEVEDGPPRLVVWSTAPNAEAAQEWDEAVEELLAKDPEDVPAPRPEVFPPEELHRRVRNDRGAASPRFMPDGRLLFASWTANSQGFARPDLYIWDPEGGEERVTRGASIVAADPHPDGARAIAVRSDWGVQSLVEVDLESGGWTALTEPSTRVLDCPRISPDGTELAYLVKGPVEWELRVRELATGAEQVVPMPASAIAADPAWLADGTGLVVSLAEGGFIELAVVTPEAGLTEWITATRGGAFAPVVGAEELFFLTMDGQGLDLRRMPAPTAGVPSPEAAASEVLWGDEPAPETAPPTPRTSARSLALRPEPPPPIDAPPTEPVEAEGYGYRPQLRPLLGASVGPHHVSAHGLLVLEDIAGKLDLLAIAGARPAKPGGVDGFGLAGAWRGPLRVELHGYRLREDLDGDVLLARQGLAATLARDTRWQGGGGELALDGLLDAGFGEDVAGARRLGLLRGSARHRAWLGTVALGGELGGHFALGRTGDEPWSRTEAEGALGFGSRGWMLSGRAALGQVAGATGLDAYRLGGMRSTLVPELAQRGHLLLPMFAPGSALGEQRQSLSVELDVQGTVLSWQRHAIGEASVSMIALGSRLELEPTPLVGLPAVDIEAGASCTLADVDGPVARPCTHLADYSGWAALVWRP